MLFEWGFGVVVTIVISPFLNFVNLSHIFTEFSLGLCEFADVSKLS